MQVVMTQAATEFITPLTLGTLSKRPVLSTFTNTDNGTWNNHVELGLWADAVVIAPATAKTLAKCAAGVCDDLLTAVYLSARCPVFFSPAMDVDMYRHPSTQKNLTVLKQYGNLIIDSEHGELASGLIGEGRLAEPENIVKHLVRHFSVRPVARGKKVLITAGPTAEPIDPVRYISNRSTGKMGFAIAEAFADAGSDVRVICGPVTRLPVHDHITVNKVETAAEMFEETQTYFREYDLVIFSAAVADYTPAQVSDQKIKKQGNSMHLDLVKTTDIAATLGQQKKQDQLLIGFALETEHEMEYALDKLRRKNLDYIVLNSLNDVGSGFAHDTNKITVIDKSENIQRYPLKSKSDVAKDILNIILEKWSEV